MSIEKVKRHKEEKHNRIPGSNKYDEDAKSYRRDTICAILVLAVLLLSPVGITLYENHQAALEAQAQQELLEALMATPSDATPSEAASEAS